MRNFPSGDDTVDNFGGPHANTGAQTEGAPGSDPELNSRAFRAIAPTATKLAGLCVPKVDKNFRWSTLIQSEAERARQGGHNAAVTNGSK